MITFGSLKRSEKRSVDVALDMEGGYALDFSNRTIEEYFEDEFGIEFYADSFGRNGNSKANRLRTILDDQLGPTAGHILRNLWDYRSTILLYSDNQDPAAEDVIRQKFMAVVARLEGDAALPDISVIKSPASNNTLYELVQSIERDIRADKPQAALDRLHLFCVMKFRHLLNARGISTDQNEPLHSLAGKYKKALEDERQHSEMSLLFIRYSIAVFEKFNDLRNNRSLAHENELLSLDEARFVFEAIGAVLRHIKRTEPAFEAE